MKTARIRIVRDPKTGRMTNVMYEAEGYVGSSCEQLQAVMSSIGKQEQYQATHSAREIPIPVPVNVK